MMNIRRAEERGRTRWDWLDSRHTFSFGEYRDPAHMSHRTLRVINDDRVAPGAGFGSHSHRDMEILSYVLDGALEHKDSMGTGSVIRPGEIQHMRAGTGVIHSEYNHSAADTAHFLQIWIMPGERGLPPAYGQLAFDRARAQRDFILLASRDGRDGSLAIRQDADLWMTQLSGDATRMFRVREGRSAWLHVARGTLDVNGTTFREGDGAAMDGEATLTLRQGKDAELLLFDLG
jgi:redox-sensitive bicupin YhaK (pirin superfamily)